jgi:hypothetical protein
MGGGLNARWRDRLEAATQRSAATVISIVIASSIVVTWRSSGGSCRPTNAVFELKQLLLSPARM